MPRSEPAQRVGVNSRREINPRWPGGFDKRVPITNAQDLGQRSSTACTDYRFHHPLDSAGHKLISASKLLKMLNLFYL